MNNIVMDIAIYIEPSLLYRRTMIVSISIVAIAKFVSCKPGELIVMASSPDDYKYSAHFL